MATYTNQYSNFPNELYSLHEFKDADNTVSADINIIKNYMKSGNYRAAQEYMATHKSTLEKYTLSAEIINMIEEELRNIEIYAWSKKQAVFFMDDAPPNAEINDVWIGGRAL